MIPQILINLLEQYIKPEAALLQQLGEMIRIVEKSKGEILEEQGKICRYIYFIEKGLARGFSIYEGKEITTWFAAENEIITSMYSMATSLPCTESIELLENSILYTLGKPDLYRLYELYPSMNVIGRLLTEKYYIELEERTIMIQSKSAREKYISLLRNQPELLQRVSLGQIASYLGITQETLSRIRAGI